MKNMSRREKTCLLMPFLFLCGLTLVSCKDDNEFEKTLPRFIEALPSAENVMSTSAYIPVNEKGNIELRLSYDGKIFTYPTDYTISYSNFLDGKDGFELKGLQPSRTYYYTMVYHISKNKEVYSKQIKSFTTQGVSIEFIGQGESNKLRLKIHDADEEDADSHVLNVVFYGVNSNGEIESVFTHTTHIGNGIWEQDYWRPAEGDRWKAVVKCSLRDVAETPVYTFVNGEWKVF